MANRFTPSQETTQDPPGAVERVGGALRLQDQHFDPKVVDRNTKIIGRLVSELERLIAVLERQRVLAPEDLLPLKRELVEIRKVD
jgi:hypothetical protein